MRSSQTNGDWQEAISLFQEAITAEVDHAKHSGSGIRKVSRGIQVTTHQGEFVYSFKTKSDLHMTPRSSASVCVEGSDRWVRGLVVSCDESEVVVALREPIGKSVESASISDAAWQLLDALNERLGEIGPSNRLAVKLLNGHRQATKEPIQGIKRGQDEAVRHAMDNDITVIWGPPGTGKTYTMAKLAVSFALKGLSAIVVSHTNVAVDGVTKEIYKRMCNEGMQRELEHGALIRFGDVRDKALEKNDDVVSLNVVLKRDPVSNDRLRELIGKRASLKKDGKRYTKELFAVEQEINDIRERIRNEEDGCVRAARIVTTTATKLYANKLFDGSRYDVVMFDEISMAHIPQVIAAASLATSRLVCVGDFRQLAPIVGCEDQAAGPLRSDLFEYLGIVDKTGQAFAHPWLVMLNEQRRMHPGISRFSNYLAYSGLLRDDPMAYNKRVITERRPFPNEALVLMDISGLYCPSKVDRDNHKNSRVNILSALLSFGIAVDAASGDDASSVSIVTPYAAQKALINSLINDQNRAKKGLDISCDTIHGFQGSERNVVVLDCVESFPLSKLSKLTSGEGDSALRLVNVAATRAQGKLVVVANVDYWESLADECNPFLKLIEYIRDNGRVIFADADDSTEAIAGLSNAAHIDAYVDMGKATNLLNGDIRNCKERFSISLAGGHLANEYSGAILDAIQSSAAKGTDIDCMVRNADDVTKSWMKYCRKSSTTFPLALIDEKVAWYGMPVTEGEVRSNVTSRDSSSPIAIRITGGHTTAILGGLTYTAKKEKRSSDKTKGASSADYDRRTSPGSHADDRPVVKRKGHWKKEAIEFAIASWCAQHDREFLYDTHQTRKARLGNLVLTASPDQIESDLDFSDADMSTVFFLDESKLEENSFDSSEAIERWNDESAEPEGAFWESPNPDENDSQDRNPVPTDHTLPSVLPTRTWREWGKQAIIDAVEDWCRQNGRSPQPGLFDVRKSTLGDRVLTWFPGQANSAMSFKDAKDLDREGLFTLDEAKLREWTR